MFPVKETSKTYYAVAFLALQDREGEDRRAGFAVYVDDESRSREEAEARGLAQAREELDPSQGWAHHSTIVKEFTVTASAVTSFAEWNAAGWQEAGEAGESRA